VEGEVNAKAPGTESDHPPVSVEAASACPYVMALALGQELTVEMALLTVTLTDPMTAL
jgi:hypothetical protein